ncbi:MAG: DUF362 domain-containing protein [Chloroflexia bacterium]|nr:DUF362 domain-containing protein [Chloroflexia bacterium]
MLSNPTVALTRGVDRVATLRSALELVIDEIDWASRRSVLIKPNLVMVERPLAITHCDALATVLELVRTRYSGALLIAEGCALRPTSEAFEAQGYPELARFYQAQLLDLNGDEPIGVVVRSRDDGPLRLRLARSVVHSDCRISLGLPKTHDAVLVTLSIKNMIMGSLVNRRLCGGDSASAWRDRLAQIAMGHGNGRGSDKRAMHQSYPALNLNLALLAPVVWPHLSILDGWVAMEGAGPVDGTPVPLGVALAGRDPLAVDVLAARLMGFALDEVGYLSYCASQGLGCGDIGRMDLLGGVEPEAITRHFVRHPQHQAQRHWEHPGATYWLRCGVEVIA